MSTMITFKGYSDDTFGWYPHGDECAGEDHDDCARLTVRTYVVEADGERMAVTGVYGHGCMWSVGIAPVDDDEPMPSWPMLWTFDGYSARLTLTFHGKFTVKLVCPQGANA